MDEKTISTLEYPKIIARLAGYAAFSASAALARALRPTNDLELARERQARTSEARRLLSEQADVGIGGAHDIRPQLNLAERGGVLTPEEILEIQVTLTAARDLRRAFEKFSGIAPRLCAIAADLVPPAGLIEAISRVLSEKGEVLDHASQKLATLRKELKVCHERLLNKLEKFITEPNTVSMLQEAIITLRNGRYVVPLRAEFKSKLKGVTQDQSSSGATLFMEPLAVVELNNRWHEAQLAEQEEVRRILAELSAQIGSHTTQLQTIVRSLASLDLSLMCAKYAEDLKAAEPIIEPFPQNANQLVILRLIHARHPLLDPQSVVPIDVALEKGTHAVVITGPNTGGKTVTLKTVGLLALMAQSGLHIPAQSGSRLRIFQDIYADIGDEQSIEQSLSTFSSHITNIVRILKRVKHNTLVLLDELGAGTDPQEGSALARAILGYLVARKAPCLVATHFPELKLYAHSTPGVMNASVEFDLKSLKPTYHLMMGLPGRSNALSIAQRLGLLDNIIQDAREMINPADLKAEDLLDEIHRQREETRQANTAAELERQEAHDLRLELDERLEKIDQERQEILEKARQEAQQEVERVRQELKKARKALRDRHYETAEIKQVSEQVERIDESVKLSEEPRHPAVQAPRPLQVGDRVLLRTLRVDGVVMGISSDEVEVQVGKMRMRVPVHLLERSSVEASKMENEDISTSRLPYEGLFPSPGQELHLRGMRVEQALAELEQYLDRAYAAGLPYVRIVHGKGTGTLRQVVRESLSDSPLVKSWEVALDNEGGEGVTVAHLKTE
jgi:DNA mismatch repair protein MutS2